MPYSRCGDALPRKQYRESPCRRADSLGDSFSRNVVSLEFCLLDLGLTRCLLRLQFGVALAIIIITADKLNGITFNFDSTTTTSNGTVVNNDNFGFTSSKCIMGVTTQQFHGIIPAVAVSNNTAPLCHYSYISGATTMATVIIISVFMVTLPT